MEQGVSYIFDGFRREPPPGGHAAALVCPRFPFRLAPLALLLNVTGDTCRTPHPTQGLACPLVVMSPLTEGAETILGRV